MSTFPGFLTLVLIFHVGLLVKGQPAATVICGADGLVHILISNIDDLDAWASNQGKWNLSGVNDGSCSPQSFEGNQVTYTNINAVACSASIDEDGDYIVYTFTIRAVVEGSTPTLAYDHEYDIACTYDRDGQAISSFTPLQQVSASGSGYEDIDFSMELSPSTADIPLGDSITATVSVVDHTSGALLDLLLKSCYSTYGSSQGKYDLITNSCPIASEVSIYTCASQISSTEEFTLSAFRYGDQSPNDFVTLTCEVYVCLSMNSGSICRSKCDNCSAKTRKRRSIDYGNDDMVFRVYSKPFRVVDPDLKQKASESKEQATVFPTSLIIGLCLGGVVAVATISVAVVILIRKRSHRFSVSEPAIVDSRQLYKPANLSQVSNSLDEREPDNKS